MNLRSIAGILFFVLAFLIPVSGQWQQLTPPVTNFNAQDVYFVDANTGFTVGGAVALKTTDGGTTWSQLSGFTNANLFGVYFRSASLGWIVGGGGSIRKTTDGGSTWTAQTSGLGLTSIYSVYFVNDNIGWCVGASGKILKTTNGGTNWTEQTSGVNTVLREVQFIDENTGWTGGGTAFLRTTNGGTTWSPVTQFGELRDFHFLNASLGFAVETFGADNRTLKTTDGGATWQVGGILSTGAFYFYSIQFTSANIGYVAGYIFSFFGYPGIMKTTDGGATWANQSVDPAVQSGSFTALHFLNDNVGWAVGNLGVIYKTTNGGITSVEGSSPIPLAFELEQNYPNPFNPETKISFSLPSQENVVIKLYNMAGQEIGTLVNSRMDAGNHSLTLSAEGLASGVYLYRMTAGGFTSTKKLSILK